jgi:hypothetical protein
MIGLLMSLSVIAARGQLHDRDEGESAQSLAGSWNVVVDPGGPTSFRTLITYAEGGGMVATPPVLPPPFRASTVHGTWVKVGGRKFIITFLFLIYDPTGQFIGTGKVRQTLTLNRAGDDYDGIASTEIFDPAGNPLPQFSACGTFQGKRIKAERPVSCP